MTTEEQVAAVRAQVESEREGLRPDGWWNQPNAAAVTEKRNRVVRFAGDPNPARRSGATGKRRNVVMASGARNGGRRE